MSLVPMLMKTLRGSSAKTDSSMRASSPSVTSPAIPRLYTRMRGSTFCSSSQMGKNSHSEEPTKTISPLRAHAFSSRKLRTLTSYSLGMGVLLSA